MPPKGKKKATKADENPVKENDVVEEKDQEDNVAENIGSNEEGEDESSGSKSPNGETHSDESDKKTETMEDDDEDDTVEKVKSKKGRRKKKELSEEKPTRASKRNLKSDDDDDIDAQKPAPKHSKSTFSSKSAGFACEKTTPDGKPANLKISAWNVAGLRAWVKKDGSLDYVIHQEQPDMMVLLETKCADNKLPPEVKIPDYQMYTVCSEKEGYCGVMLYSKVKPMSVQYGIGNKEFDNEGRCIIAEFKDFYLVCAYVPNAGQGLKTLPKRLKWNNEFLKLLKSLDEKKPVVLCGDLNVAHEPIDLANPKTNTKNAGFTKDERDDFTKLLNEGFVDSFRHLYPDRTGAYTFWSNRGGARSRNVGWRLDYFVLSKRLIPNLCDSLIRPQIMGSDHCPITLCLNV